jgi:hypothetical protein
MISFGSTPDLLVIFSGQPSHHFIDHAGPVGHPLQAINVAIERLSALFLAINKDRRKEANMGAKCKLAFLATTEALKFRYALCPVQAGAPFISAFT